MAVTNPSCCSLRLGTQIIAIFNIIFSVIAFVSYASLLVICAALTNGIANNKSNNDGGLMPLLLIAGLVLTIIMIIASLISIGSGILLFIGAQERDPSKCRLSFNISAVLLLIYSLCGLAIISISYANLGNGVAEAIIMTQVCTLVIGVLFELYLLWVVYAFIDEIKRGGGRENTAHSDVQYTQTPKSEFTTTPPAPLYSAAPGQVYNPTTTYQNEPATVKHPLPTENA